MKRKDLLKDYRLINEEGRGEKRWEYCGKYYTFDLPRKVWIGHKLFLLSLSAFQTAVIIAMGMVNNPGSRLFFTVIPYLGMLFISVSGVWNSASLFMVKEKFTQRVYERNFLWLRRGTEAQVVLSCIMIIGEAFIILQGADVGSEIIVLAGAALVAVTAAVQRARLSRHPCKPATNS